MTVYRDDELRLFNSYTNLLRELVVKEQGTFDNIVLNSAKCEHCARICPSGIPRQLRDTDRVACPACVKHRALVPALTRELHGNAGAQVITNKTDTSTLTAEVAREMTKAREKRLKANPPPTVERQLKRLADGIHRMKAAITPSLSVEEREAREKIVAAMIAGYKRQSGGLDPPAPEPRKPDEVLP